MSFVELMVAIVILALAVLGLASTSDASQRAMIRGRLRAEAAARAASVIDSLRSRACRGGGSASGSDRGQSWTISARGVTRVVVDSVQANGRRFVVEGVAVCP